MKKVYKSLMLASSIGLMAVTLASCGKDTRNSATPYGENNKYLSEQVIATANDGLTMTMTQFYDSLRNSSYSLVEQEIKKAIYNDEYNAVKELLLNDNPNALSTTSKNIISITRDGNSLIDLSAKTLDPEDKLTNYEYIRQNIIFSISSSLSNTIYGTSSAKSILAYEKADAKKTSSEIKTIDDYQTKFIEAAARTGITLTKSMLTYKQPTDDSDIIIFDHFSDFVSNDAYAALVESSIIGNAEQLSSMNAVYKIADEEYIHQYNDEDGAEKTKNISYYLFGDKADTVIDEKIEKKFDDTYKTYGEYKVIVLQYSTRNDALTAMKSWDSGKTDLENYIELYKNLYSYEKNVTVDSDCFKYEVNSTKNDLSNLNSDVQTLITDSLEDGECLKTPRNIGDKYIMAYRISTTYDISGSDEELSYKDIFENEATRAKYNNRIKFTMIQSVASSYSTTNYKAKLYTVMNDKDEANDLKIYDPVFEYKYLSNNTDTYQLMNKKDYTSNLIFSYGSYEYTVDDFFNTASKQNGTSILTNHFQLEYAYKNCRTYVDEDTLKDNKKALSDAISTFNKNNNDSYPKSIGLENFLLLSYGYKSEEDIIKYSYEAKECLTEYKNVKVFEAWAKASAEDSSKNVINKEKVGILENILKTGNSTYSTLFNINLDHILINIDYDGDGSPDDPQEFLKDKDDDVVKDFEDAVTALAQIIYTEATSGKYGDNSLYKILSYIKDAYNENAYLKSDGHTTETWAKYKKFNFLLTVEQLASSGDITQDTVSNFVTPFADYVKKVYEKVADKSLDMDDYKNGVFFIYDKQTDTGSELTKDTEADQITIDSLCSTVFGYHLLVLNSYEGPKTTKYEVSSSDTFQKNLSILLIEDEDDEENNLVVTVDSTNTDAKAANIEQLFVYYVQKANGTTSSLDEDVQSILGTLFDNAIATYSSSNFQTYLLLKELNIQITDPNFSAITVDNKGLDVTYYANQITNYGAEKKYLTWVDGTTYDWTRPTKD